MSARREISAREIGAAALMYQARKRRREAFALVTSDSDFTSLALRLRESGKVVYGLGGAKTPASLQNACDRFIRLESLGRVIGVVTQDAHLFHETIRSNLLYARPDATDEQCLDVLRRSAATSLLRRADHEGGSGESSVKASWVRLPANRSFVAPI